MAGRDRDGLIPRGCPVFGPAVGIVGGDTATPAMLLRDEPATTVFRVTARDPAGLTDTDDVVVTAS
jgi:hypothetical protein